MIRNNEIKIWGPFLAVSLIVLVGQAVSISDRPVNILMLLADDLGYGDTSVSPFVGTGIKTPELEKMSAKGMVMTNFHSAAATCSPTRASILTGLYPWRMGMKAVFEYGEKGKSNRDDWLPLLPTSAMVFRDNRYFTGHAGKWHLSGMRNDDYEMRKLPVSPGGVDDGSAPGMKRCPHPGPNQQGFDEYVSVLDGPGAPRQNELQVPSVLYSKGCEYLMKNDVPIGRAGGPSDELLSDCEARHAIRMMHESVAANKSFFIQLWFHAPHGPWEDIPRHRTLYDEEDKREVENLPLCAEAYAAAVCASARGPGAVRQTRSGRLIDQYKTMVTAMDHAVGTVLRAIESMGIEQHTLVVFTSDNGPEFVTRGGNAGGTGGLRGAKRTIYEGGVRVPTIVQWVGTIPPGKTDFFGMSTDFYPTFLDAAGLRAPANVKLDGISLLPLLWGGSAHPRMRHKAKRRAVERVALWHNDFEGPRASAIWIFDFKLFLNAHDSVVEMYDMRVDRAEQHNLLAAHTTDILAQLTQHPQQPQQPLNLKPDSPLFTHITNSRVNKTGGEDLLDVLSRSVHDAALRSDPRLHLWVVTHAYPTVRDFATYGNEAHRLYLKEARGREYVATMESDTRHMVRNQWSALRNQLSLIIIIIISHHSLPPPITPPYPTLHPPLPPGAQPIQKHPSNTRPQAQTTPHERHLPHPLRLRHTQGHRHTFSTLPPSRPQPPDPPGRGGQCFQLAEISKQTSASPRAVFGNVGTTCLAVESNVGNSSSNRRVHPLLLPVPSLPFICFLSAALVVYFELLAMRRHSYRLLLMR